MKTDLQKTNRQTQARARQHLQKASNNYWIPTEQEKQTIIQKVYCYTGITINSKSFSMCYPYLNRSYSFEDSMLIQVKGTNNAKVRDDFQGYFMSITENEEKAALALGPNKYIFALVNVLRENIRLLTYEDIMNRAQLRYRTWSIQL
jgi:hypothetical protein